MEKEFLAIVNNHRNLIFKVVNLYCSDPEDRKDLFQEIIYQAWKSLKSFRNESKLSTWMYRIALNTAITHFKKEKRATTTPLDNLPFDIPDVNEGLTHDENISALLKAISQLDKIDKSIVLLYLDDNTYEQMSDITGLSQSNVGVRLNRIKSKLSQLVKSMV